MDGPQSFDGILLTAEDHETSEISCQYLLKQKMHGLKHTKYEMYF